MKSLVSLCFPKTFSVLYKDSFNEVHDLLYTFSMNKMKKFCQEPSTARILIQFAEEEDIQGLLPEIDNLDKKKALGRALTVMLKECKRTLKK